MEGTPWNATVRGRLLFPSWSSGHGVGVPDEPPDHLRYSLPLTATFCFGYALVFALGLVGNSVVLVVVIRNAHMRTVTNWFIANLALADTLVTLFCLPATLVSNIFKAWILGLFMCKAVSYLQGVSVSASINTLVAISIDRCLAICYPMSGQISTVMCRIIIMVIWAWSLLISLPWALYFTVVTHRMDHDRLEMPMCLEKWPWEGGGVVYFLVAHLLMCYLIPLSAIIVCYFLIWRCVCQRQLPGETKSHGGVEEIIHKSKMKVIKMLLAVVVLFAVSWLPLYAIFTRIKCGDDLVPGSWEEALLQALTPVAQWLGASNSCINPILYAYFNSKFRAGFKAILTSRSCCGPLRYPSPFRDSTYLRASSACSTKLSKGVVERKLTLMSLTSMTPV